MACHDDITIVVPWQPREMRVPSGVTTTFEINSDRRSFDVVATQPRAFEIDSDHRYFFVPTNDGK